MKVKKFTKRKKLTLNKKTIARLNDAELKVVIGGLTPPLSYCICCTCTRTNDI
jgi:natural product precursor